jgi:probable HAF family extracellular repeat protein
MRTAPHAVVERLEDRRLLTTYTVTDLGSLGGGGTRADDLTDAGDVVGSSVDADGRTRAFLWRGGVMTDLGTLGGPTSRATEINNAGEIVGVSGASDTGPGAVFRWRGGVMTDLGLDPQFAVTGLNDPGQIVGNLNGRALLWQDGVTTDLGALGSSGASAADINNSGQVAAWSPTDVAGTLVLPVVHTFRWQDGSVTDVGTAPFTMGSYANAINASGQIVGSESVYLNTGYGAAVVSYPFFFDGASFVQIPVSGLNTVAADINDFGQVIGTMTGGPFLFEGGVVKSLNALVPPGVVLGGATAINNAGQIIGYTAGANSRAVLLTPDVASPGPEVQVWVGGAEVASGTGSVAFGTTRLTTPVTRTVNVRDVGDQPLELAGPIGLPAGFSLVSGFGATSLAPGAVTTFVVRLDAAVAGNVAGQVSFTTNDADEGRFTFAVSGAVLPIRTIDDGAAGFASTGFTTLSGQGNLNDVRRALAGNGAAAATWTFDGLAPGVYRVSATWSTASNRATNAPYTVFDGATPLGTVAVNQRLAPGDFADQDVTWANLGDFTVVGGSLGVRLTNLADGWIIADSVRIELVAPVQHVELPAPAPVPTRPVKTTRGTPKATPVWGGTPITAAKPRKSLPPQRRPR